MRSAAIFDLDRTLLDGGSGPTISRILAKEGITSGEVPGQKLLYWIYNTFGENRASMVVAKQGARFAKGWKKAAVQSAGERVAIALQDVLQPFALAELAKHRKEERLLVLATTTPYDLVAPFAELLGMDAVLATRYDDTNGIYNGSIDGRFVWYSDKRDEVADWAAANNVDLAESYAYSDSRYDAPMLRSVGNPVAVNPDPRLRVLAELSRWEIRYLDAPPGVRRVAGVELQQLAFPFLQPELLLYADLTIAGEDNIPLEGPAIIAANHRSYFDPMAIGYALAKRDRPGRFLAKSELYKMPVVKQFMQSVGAVPVFRGTGSDEPLHAAAEALDAGEVVVILPEGTIPRGEKFFDPQLTGKSGVARLAALTKVPVLPMGLWGTEHVWPRNAKLPKFLNVKNPPAVSINIGAPVELAYKGVEEDLNTIMAAISAQLPPESQIKRIPTEAELAATHPKGK